MVQQLSAHAALVENLYGNSIHSSGLCGQACMQCTQYTPAH